MGCLSGAGGLRPKAALLVALFAAALLHRAPRCDALQPLAQSVARLGDLLRDEVASPLRAALGVSPNGADGGLDLELLTDAPKFGAACLDGSPPGYYFRPGHGSGASSFLLFIDGGGWCYDEDACFERSFTILGSSSAWPPHKPPSLMFPMVSADPDVNPFYNWNIVELNYCDGASFSGDVDGSVVVKGKPLYFRGRRILEYVLRHLRDTKGLLAADRVLLSGCSAGALSAILNADRVAGFLAPQTDFKVIPFSGFFPRADTFAGQPWFAGVVRHVASMQNVSASLSPACKRAHPGLESEWQCLFAENAYPHVRAPIFLVNSVFDSWTIQNIYNVTADFPRSQEDKLVPFLNQRATHVWDLISQSVTWRRRGNGGFLNACVTHCWGCCDPGGWAKVTDARGVTTKEAVERWYFAQAPDQDQRSPKPCQLTSDPPFNCNPTCPNALAAWQ